MRISQKLANAIFVVSAILVTLYSEGYTEGLMSDNVARFLFCCIIVAKAYLLNTGYDRLPSGQILPPDILHAKSVDDVLYCKECGRPTTGVWAPRGDDIVMQKGSAKLTADEAERISDAAQLKSKDASAS